jgi:hypothetical protein
MECIRDFLLGKARLKWVPVIALEQKQILKIGALNYKIS